MNAFLLALPAVLGIVGFVIYHLLKKSVTADPIIKSIIAKLKTEQPEFYKHLQKLPEAERSVLITKDNEYKAKLSETDRAILNRIITNQFRTNIFVYALCGLLLITGLYLYLKPKPLSVNDIQLQNTDSKAQDLVSDLDPITVTWASGGTDGELSVALENAETGKQTKRVKVLASEGKVKFLPDNYDNFDQILSNRRPNSFNRVRAVLYAGTEAFKSKEVELRVGVKVIAYEELPAKIRFNAIVDQRIISSFRFEPRMALFQDEHFNGKQQFEAPQYDSEPFMVIEHPERFTPDGLVFTVNPEAINDSRLIRLDEASLRSAILALRQNALKKKK
jgi:hypothetical protein